MPVSLSRRGFLTRAAATAAAGIVAPGAGLSLPPPRQCFAPRLVVERRLIEVNGKAASVFGVTGPDGRQGLELGPDERFLFDVVNRSGDATIVHWHGQTPSYQQDGVVETGYEGPIGPGERHLYDFATRPGTHWMHSHLGLQEQALLAAPLIIRSVEDMVLDAQEVTLFLHDFSFKPPEELMAQILGVTALRGAAGAPPGICGAGDLRSASLVSASDVYLNHVDYDAYLANDRTLDDPCVVRTERGGRVRLRVINGASGTAFWITLGDPQGEMVKGRVIAVDGNAVKPVTGSRFPLAQGQRLDILVDLPAGASLPVLAQREGDRARTGLILASPGAAIGKISPVASVDAEPIDLSLEARLEAVTPLRLKTADTKRRIALAGSMVPFLWTINDRLWADHAAIRVDHGERVVFEIGNSSFMAHAMHLHGHVFQVVAINGKPFLGAMRDTVLVPAFSTVSIAFDADNLGRWLLHCHNLWHMTAGMMTQLDYKYAV